MRRGAQKLEGCKYSLLRGARKKKGRKKYRCENKEGAKNLRE